MVVGSPNYIRSHVAGADDFALRQRRLSKGELRRLNPATEDSLMSTRQRVLQLLRGPVASRIRFKFPFWAGTVTISPVSFRHVAHAIETGHVHLDVTNAFPAGVAGQYVSGTPNTLRVKPIIGRVEEGLVLHECTHAIFDLTHTHVAAIDDEAASYVVDALYFRMTGLPRPRWNAPTHATAGAVADRLLRHYAVGTRGIPTIDMASWNALRGTIMVRPIYINGPAGILGTLLGSQYPHDG
jgi:hypothetical protein